MKSLWHAVALAAALVLAGNSALLAQQPFVLYDTFDSGRIDPGLWVVRQSGSDAGREYVREVLSGFLRLADAAYGDTTSDSGGRFDGAFLEFPDVSSITAFGSVVAVSRFAATGCTGVPQQIGSARAEFFGDFFNTAVPTPGSHTNDVRASISISRVSNSADPGNILRVQGLVNHCLDGSCSNVDLLGSADLGTIAAGVPTFLFMAWDQPNHRFWFLRDSQPLVQVGYAVSDTSPPGALRKGLLVAGAPPNCTAAPRPVAFMEAFFDTVIVNAPAGP